METTWLWIVGTVLLFTAEVLTSTFKISCFAIGCMVAAAISLFVDYVVIQFIAFSITSLIALVLVKKLAEYHNGPGKREDSHTNIDRLRNKTATVIIAIGPDTQVGRIRINGDTWRALSKTGATLETGTQVRIVGHEGNTLQVEPTSN